MSKKLVIVRNERSTYEVHIESGNPPQKFVGGQSLDLERLRTELFQHGCPDAMVSKALGDVESTGFTTISL